MAKEMLIIFVYDTQMLQGENDDLASAILYFHPTWVSDQQKTALCGQLIGTVHCVKNVLAPPKIVSLQSGKFFIKEYGRYLMAVGTDRNIADWLLEHRAKTMCSLISFLHQDIDVMSKRYENNSKLSAKLYLLFETYLKYLFVGGNIFSYIPSIKLPKSASNVFLEAMHILECCQEVNYVLGGTLLYHNKVVATQLNSDLTKRLVLIDPYRIKYPAETVTADFEVPLGIQLLQVYISSKEYSKLHGESTRCSTIFQYLNNKSIRKMKSSISKEPVKSAMKRDQSIIFTAVPEEDTDPAAVPPPPPPEKSADYQNRPKFLNLKSKITDFNLEMKHFATKQVPQTPLYGQTSVCSTPMTDLNKVIHSKQMSICINPVENENKLNENHDKDHLFDNSRHKLDDLKLIPVLKVSNNLYDKKKNASTFDVREKLQSTDKSITMKYYNPNSTEKVTPRRSPTKKSNRYKTIADPNYPIFKSDGTVVSHQFYKDHVHNQMKMISVELKMEDKIAEITDKKFDSFDCSMNKENSSFREKINIADLSSISNQKNKDRRKSLSLPLKPLSNDSSDQRQAGSRRHSSGVQLTPLMSKLSSFTFDDKAAGFCSKDSTPLFTPTQSNVFFAAKKIDKCRSVNDGGFQKCILFVCGQQDMVVNLLLQEDCCSSREAINQLWELCTENLAKLEKQLHHCLETYPAGNIPNDSEPYSYLQLESDWDTVQRGGPWGSAELGALTFFHRDFKENPSVTELLMRCCDGVIYGHHCGQTEVFYHQPANSYAGLPPPADLMGNISLKAKRRLERDHSIILL